MTTQAQPTHASAERSPGRPREPEVDQRILDAAFQLMAQHGYNRMSMDAVAANAGVTKPTIYRRYASKIELATAAVIAYCQQKPPTYPGNTRGDLVAQMSDFRRALDRPFGMAMLGTMLAEEHDTPELLACFRTYLVAPRRKALHAILAEAQARNEFRPDAKLDQAVNFLIGSYYAQYVAGDPLPDDWATEVVDSVLEILKPA